MRKTVQPIAWPPAFEEARTQVQKELDRRGAIVHRVAVAGAARDALRKALDDAELVDIPVQQIARWMTGCEDVGVISSEKAEIRVCVTGRISSLETFHFSTPDGTLLSIRLTSED